MPSSSPRGSSPRLGRRQSDKERGKLGAKSNFQKEKHDGISPRNGRSGSKVSPRASPRGSPRLSRGEARAQVTHHSESDAGSSNYTPSHGAENSDRFVHSQLSSASHGSTNRTNYSNRQALSASSPVEEFLMANLLPTSDHAEHYVVQIKSTEPISDAVEQMHRFRQYSCVVTFDDGRREFFDCMDFAAYLVEVLGGKATSSSGALSFASKLDWKDTKERIRRVGEDHVAKALRRERGEEFAFRRFDAESSLEELLSLLRRHTRVPVYRDGELCSIITASNILELCHSVTKDSRESLDQLCLSDAMARWPDMVSTMHIPDGQSLVEALHSMATRNVAIVPITSGEKNDQRSPGLKHEEEGGEALVGQFNISALRAIFSKRRASDDYDEGHRWWWEDSTVVSNILLETPMDFIALSPKGGRSSDASAPWAAAFSEESLARAISRATKTKHRSVVVYKVAERSAATKPLEGIASTFGLLTAMMEVGVFETLQFSPGFKSRDSKNRLTLTADQAQGMVAQFNNDDTVKYTKVRFDNHIEVDQLVIPTCPEHGIIFMRFVKEDDANNVNRQCVDFRALKDANITEARALGCRAQCLGCQRTLGVIEPKRMPEFKEPSRERCNSAPGLFGSLGNLGQSLLPWRRAGTDPPTAGPVGVLKKTSMPSSLPPNLPPAPGGNSPRASPRKAHGERGRLAVAHTNSNAAEASSSSVAKKESEKVAGVPSRSNSDVPVPRSSFFGLGECCTCQCSNHKEQIASSSAVSNSGKKKQGDDAGNGSERGPAVIPQASNASKK